MTEKRDMAKSLFFAGYDQKKIAAALKVAEKTVSEWSRRDNWRKQKSEQMMWEDTNFERVQRIVAHNLRILTKQIEDQESAGGELTLIDKGHFDAIAKAMSSIRKQETRWSDEAKTMRLFVKWLADSDAPQRRAMAASIEEDANSWLIERRKTYE